MLIPEEYREKTNFSTNQGALCWIYMPFGFRNARGTFHRSSYLILCASASIHTWCTCTTYWSSPASSKSTLGTSTKFSHCWRTPVSRWRSESAIFFESLFSTSVKCFSQVKLPSTRTPLPPSSTIGSQNTLLSFVPSLLFVSCTAALSKFSSRWLSLWKVGCEKMWSRP